MSRVLVAGLFHETHTFLRGTTALKDFGAFTASQVLNAAGEPSQVAGAMEVAAEAGWEVVPGPYLLGDPSGMVDDEVIEFFWAGIRDILPTVDGVHLDLHGAMVSRSFPDVEGEILRRVRSATKVPVGVALDFHGNMTAAMELEGVFATAYRKNPHTDAKETTIRAARGLARILETGERPRMVREQPTLVWPPTGTGTANEPVSVLEAAARQIEAENPEILDVSVFGGFAFADIPECGVSFLAVTTGDPETARTQLRRLSDLAYSLKEKGCPARMALSKTLDKVQSATPAPKSGPIVIVEPADNIGGGAPGDCTWILQGLVERDIGNSAVALTDPAAIASLWDAPNGAEFTLPLGGKSGELGCEPVPLTVTKISQSDGTYQLADRHSHNAMYGLTQSMGKTVVVRTANGVIILLNSHKTAPMDLGMWISQGIDPRSLSVIGVKAAVAHRQAYDPIASAMYWVDTPGPCDENLHRLPFRNIRRPIWPLDGDR